jgi:hypothetical protein
MERYKSEREQLRTSLSHAHSELQGLREKDKENEQTIHSLQTALEESTQQVTHEDQDGAWQEQVVSLQAQLEESNKRMYRYREERNTGKVMLKSLQEQINTLQSTVDQLQNTRSYDTYTGGPLDSEMLARLQLLEDSTELPATGSPHDEAYSPEEYSDLPQTLPTTQWSRSGSKKSGKHPSSVTGASHKQHRSSSTSNRSLSPVSTEMYTEVTMKDGAVRSLVIERPWYRLSTKSKPEVVVKRKGGNFETGVLAFLGVLEGRDMAGVILHFPTGSNDGAFKDGKYYFRCTPSYGLYCPLSNIFVEANSATV